MEILKKRDVEEYASFTSEKAMMAREIAKHDQYFLPYFVIGESEESNVIGLLFGMKVIQ